MKILENSCLRRGEGELERVPAKEDVCAPYLCVTYIITYRHFLQVILLEYSVHWVVRLRYLSGALFYLIDVLLSFFFFISSIDDDVAVAACEYGE